VLQKTLGVPLFQEQAMQLAIVAAGFTPGEADQLRRAMGAWRKPGLIDRFRRKLIAGMKTTGLSPEYAEAVFHQIRGFGEYGFPESHAASFALLVYVSAWLKHHYPAAFAAALINSQPMGFYAPAQLVRNAREHGVEVRGVDVNHSDWECTLEPCEAQAPVPASPGPSNEGPTKPSPTSKPTAPEPAALRLGFCMLQGIGEAHARQIEATRREEPFSSVRQFARRTGFSRAVLSRLAEGRVFGSLGIDRREALWRSLAEDQKPLPLFDDQEEPEPPASGLPAMSEAQEVLADYRTTGMSLQRHPVAFLREGLQRRRVVEASRLATLPHGRYVRVAGIVLVRQRPSTAKGITFVTLEDETGSANLIVRPDVWKRFRKAARGATIMLAAGRLQRHGRVIHVLAAKLENLSDQLAALGTRSRDFC
jgi:error-prone DNA polymerase